MKGTVKHGGGLIMVRGCMAATGVGNLVIIDGIMKQYSYLNILKNNLSQSASKLGLDGSFTFQQDNDPKHAARFVREWLLYNVRKQVKNVTVILNHGQATWTTPELPPSPNYHTTPTGGRLSSQLI
ncbi:transposable element Tc1 transposase [Trichonephila clavipes]|nr:transposable element Tc1 transposase [Trichonephila clavipes]